MSVIFAACSHLCWGILPWLLLCLFPCISTQCSSHSSTARKGYNSSLVVFFWLLSSMNYFSAWSRAAQENYEPWLNTSISFCHFSVCYLTCATRSSLLFYYEKLNINTWSHGPMLFTTRCVFYHVLPPLWPLLASASQLTLDVGSASCRHVTHSDIPTGSMGLFRCAK